MDISNEAAGSPPSPPEVPRRGWRGRALPIAAGLAIALVMALVFAGYRRPELLLNLMGLRYCG